MKSKGEKNSNKRERKGLKRLMSGLMKVMIWSVIALVIFALIKESRKSRDEIQIESVKINIADSTRFGNLVNTTMVNKVLANNKIKTVGEPAAKVPLSLIERVVGGNGFVEKVCAYTNYSGELHIEITQRQATARILLNGYNCYVSSSGYLFSAPPLTALYTPVVTGTYRPIFPANYVGSVDEYTAKKIEELELEIEKIEREKYPILHRERENNEERRELRRRFINKSTFESREAFDARVAALREKNRLDRERLAYRQRKIDEDLSDIKRRQNVLRERQKKLQKSCDDIHNLITFVEMIEADDFWRSEIVQIMLSNGNDGQMVISMSVRSGNFNIRMGTLLGRGDYLQKPQGEESESGSAVAIRTLLPNSTTTKRMREEAAQKERKRQEALVKESIERKLTRLRSFYDAALPRVGWDRYKEINIEFENQVVCKK